MAEAARHWVLLRGLGREARHWGDLPARLAARPGVASVQTPDLPGNGQRWREASALSVAGQTEALRAALAAGSTSVQPRAVLAISLGGMVALDWASRYPAEVSRLVLLNTSLAGLAPFWQRLCWRRYPALLRLLLAGPAAREAQILALCSNQPAVSARWQADWQRWQAEAPVSAANLLRQLLAAARYRPPSAWPACPTVLLASTADRLVDVRCSQALARRTGWPLQLHGTAGHDLALDAPEWVMGWMGEV